MKLDAIFASLGLSATMGELITIVVAILVISTAFWLIIGKFRLYNVLIDIYVSLALLQVIFPVVPDFGKSTYMLVFLVLLILFILLDKYLFDIHVSGSGMAIWEVCVVSFLEIGLIASIILSYVSKSDVLEYISSDSLFYFISDWARVAWMVIPLVFIIIINKRGK
jgi:hypothetical protein